MPAKTKERMLGTIKNIEKNFQQMLKNEDVKKVLADMKKMKNKRTKQFDQLLNESWDDIKKGYSREVRGLEKFFANEKQKVNKAFQEQLTELKKFKQALEDHVASARGKKVRKVAKGKGAGKSAARKSPRKRSTVKTSPVVINQSAN